MRDLRFTGVDDDGTHLLLVDEDDQQHRVEINDALRTAVRSVRAVSGGQVDPNVRPRDVQSLLRSGLTIDEVAERTGWSSTKVALFEPPIRAERDHVAITAQRLQLHSRVAGRDHTTTVGERVGERLDHRGVAASDLEWDAWRGDRGWTIVCRFPAGGRARVATWRYDAATQSLHPTDDEARWLSEDDQVAATSPFGKPGGTTAVYDVVAEGGLDHSAPTKRKPRASAPKIPHATVEPGEESATDSPADGSETAAPDTADKPVDLVSVMRERSKNRRRPRRKSEDETAAAVPAENDQDEPATVEELGHDPVTGTADLFGLKEVGALPTAPEPSGDTDETGDSDDVVDDDTEAPDEHPDIEPGLSDELDKQDQLPERPSQARKGRPSVPSWDDIMFGKRGPQA